MEISREIEIPVKEKPAFDKELTIVMPCLNEAETVGVCIEKAKKFIDDNDVSAEIIVADNGSTDGSISIARRHGARVIHVDEKGYGAALMGGINESRSKFVIMGDSDDSHDLVNLRPFLDKLREGYDLVVGNRFKGGIDPGAMSPLNRYIGNPLLSGIGRVFFPSKAGDFHCGLRGFTRAAYEKMDLRTTGMEFASEMIVKATLFDMKIIEVPTNMSASGRSRPPHLRAFRDGWRHLRFMLLYSPKWLFFVPGLILILTGFSVGVWLLPGAKLSLDVHTMLYAALAMIIGFQSVSFALLTKTFAAQEKLLPSNNQLEKILRKVTLEKGLFIGALLLLLGLAGSIYAILLVKGGEFRGMGVTHTMRIVIPSITMMALGFQVIFASFFYSILRLKLR